MQRRSYSNQSVSPTLICNNPKCDNISSKLYIVEEKIVEALKIWLSGYKIDYGRIYSQRRKFNALIHKESISALKKELDKERKRLTKVYCFFEDGTYTKDMFINRSKSISKKIDEINSNIQKHQEEIKKEGAINKAKDHIIPKMENVLELYDSLQREEDKNNLLKAILKKVTYNKTTKAIKRNSDPTDFEITIYPTIAKEWCNPYGVDSISIRTEIDSVPCKYH